MCFQVFNSNQPNWQIIYFIINNDTHRSFILDSDTNEFFLKTKYVSDNSTQTKYIQIHGIDDHLYYKDILAAICNDTNYNEQNISHVTDRDGCKISTDHLERIVSQFIRCSYFELNVHIRSAPPPALDNRCVHIHNYPEVARPVTTTTRTIEQPSEPKEKVTKEVWIMCGL